MKSNIWETQPHKWKLLLLYVHQIASKELWLHMPHDKVHSTTLLNLKQKTQIMFFAAKILNNWVRIQLSNYHDTCLDFNAWPWNVREKELVKRKLSCTRQWNALKMPWSPRDPKLCVKAGIRLNYFLRLLTLKGNQSIQQFMQWTWCHWNLLEILSRAIEVPTWKVL